MKLTGNYKKEVLERIYYLAGKAYVTGKRVTIPKDLYDTLDKEERIEVRAILDIAQGEA